MEAVVRLYTSDDAAACAIVFDAAWHAGHPYAPRPIDRGIFEREASGERILVAEDEQRRVIGFVSVYEPGSFVHHLYVDRLSTVAGSAACSSAMPWRLPAERRP